MPKGRLAATLTRPTRRLSCSVSISRGVSAGNGSARRREAGEAALEVGDEIGQVLEPGMEADDRPALPARRGPVPLGVDRQDEAFEAAPARADAEQLHAVEHGIDRRFRRAGAEHDAKEAARAGEIAP